MCQTKTSRTQSNPISPDSEILFLSHPIWNISLIFGPIDMPFSMWFYFIYMELTAYHFKI